MDHFAEPPSHRLRSATLLWLARLAVAAAVLGIWQLLVSEGVVRAFYISQPTDIARFLYHYFADGTVWPNLETTLEETVIGFAIGMVSGVLVALALVRYAPLERLFGPFLVALNALPRVALAPLFVLWFGIGEAPKIYLAISLVFFLALLNTQAGAKSVPNDLTMTAKVMGSTRAQEFRKLILPYSIPAIFAAIKLGIVYALLGAVVGEMLSAQKGLGQQVSYYSQSFNSAGLFAVLIILAVLGVLLSSIASAVEGRLLRWKEPVR